MKMVKVLDLDTKRVTTIPVAELAPGMIRIKPGNDCTEYYVEGHKFNPKSSIQHPPLEEDDRRLIRGIVATFHDVYPKTSEEWEDAFRRDTHPKKEIGLWVLMGHVFLHFTRGRQLNYEKRKDIFDVVLATINNGPEATPFTVAPCTLDRKRVREIVDYVTAQAAAGERFPGWIADVIEHAEGERPW